MSSSAPASRVDTPDREALADVGLEITRHLAEPLIHLGLGLEAPTGQRAFATPIFRPVDFPAPRPPLACFWHRHTAQSMLDSAALLILQTHALLPNRGLATGEQIPRSMIALAFSNDIKCGILEIDRQHRRMVKIVNHLMEAVLHNTLGQTENRLLDELVRLAAQNFRAEEEWMRRCRYEHAEVHIESHAHLLNELLELRDGLFKRHEHVNRKAVAFVRRWLESHLAESDRDLARAVRLHLIEETASAQAL